MIIRIEYILSELLLQTGRILFSVAFYTNREAGFAEFEGAKVRK
jgi:hypothetical protein